LPASLFPHCCREVTPSAIMSASALTRPDERHKREQCFRCPERARIGWGRAMRGRGPGEGPKLIAFGATTHRCASATQVQSGTARSPRRVLDAELLSACSPRSVARQESATQGGDGYGNIFRHRLVRCATPRAAAPSGRRGHRWDDHRSLRFSAQRAGRAARLLTDELIQRLQALP
jgi:hypothetical protein